MESALAEKRRKLDLILTGLSADNLDVANDLIRGLKREISGIEEQLRRKKEISKPRLALSPKLVAKESAGYLWNLKEVLGRGTIEEQRRFVDYCPIRGRGKPSPSGEALRRPEGPKPEGAPSEVTSLSSLPLGAPRVVGFSRPFTSSNPSGLTPRPPASRLPFTRNPIFRAVLFVWSPQRGILPKEDSPAVPVEREQ